MSVHLSLPLGDAGWKKKQCRGRARASLSERRCPCSRGGTKKLHQAVLDGGHGDLVLRLKSASTTTSIVTLSFALMRA
jgi:hypothetical protein